MWRFISLCKRTIGYTSRGECGGVGFSDSDFTYKYVILGWIFSVHFSFNDSTALFNIGKNIRLKT